MNIASSFSPFSGVAGPSNVQQKPFIPLQVSPSVVKFLIDIAVGDFNAYDKVHEDARQFLRKTKRININTVIFEFKQYTMSPADITYEIMKHFRGYFSAEYKLHATDTDERKNIARDQFRKKLDHIYATRKFHGHTEPVYQYFTWVEGGPKVELEAELKGPMDLHIYNTKIANKQRREQIREAAKKNSKNSPYESKDQSVKVPQHQHVAAQQPMHAATSFAAQSRSSSMHMETPNSFTQNIPGPVRQPSDSNPTHNSAPFVQNYPAHNLAPPVQNYPDQDITEYLLRNNHSQDPMRPIFAQESNTINPQLLLLHSQNLQYQSDEEHPPNEGSMANDITHDEETMSLRGGGDDSTTKNDGTLHTQAPTYSFDCASASDHSRTNSLTQSQLTQTRGIRYFYPGIFADRVSKWKASTHEISSHGGDEQGIEVVLSLEDSTEVRYIAVEDPVTEGKFTFKDPDVLDGEFLKDCFPSKTINLPSFNEALYYEAIYKNWYDGWLGQVPSYREER